MGDSTEWQHPNGSTVETGASLANLDLQGLQLEKLDIEAGVGDQRSI